MHKKIIFRADAANLTSIGTGNLYRSIIISEVLKQKINLKKKEILFLTKIDKKYSIAKKILLQKKIQFHTLRSSISDYSISELNILKKYTSNLLIIDKYKKKIPKKFIIELKKKHKKILLLDDISKARDLADLSLNSMSYNVKKIKNNKTGYKYNLLPSYNFLLNKNKNKNNKKKNFLVFIFFGGYDKKKITIKLLNNLLKQELKVKYLVNKIFKKNFSKIFYKNIIFFKSKDHYNYLHKADLSINNGGLGMMDAIAFKKPTIAIAQYKHQRINIENLNRSKVVFKAKFNELITICNIIKKIKDKKIDIDALKFRQNHIINLSMMKNTFRMICKLYDK